ncbi:MAG: hypothetical protein O2816_13025 [Planctomycetota bacterium]|nr:hypothetical protein [Planctomycetota bacterium]
MFASTTLLLTLAAAGQDLDATTFEHWRDYVVPAAEDERWLEVGWRATYWDAVLEAHELERPLLMWAMNGHPLGCT